MRCRVPRGIAGKAICAAQNTEAFYLPCWHAYQTVGQRLWAPLRLTFPFFLVRLGGPLGPPPLSKCQPAILLAFPKLPYILARHPRRARKRYCQSCGRVEPRRGQRARPRCCTSTLREGGDQPRAHQQVSILYHRYAMQHSIFTGSTLPPSCGLVKRTHEGPRQPQLAGPAGNCRADVAVGSTANTALSAEQSGVLLSAHPDAVRRRREAEQR